jgi:hypothetical protein
MSTSDSDVRRGSVAQLRADIDAGRTGDKIGHPDPTLTPLGTDDEAGGAPPAGRAVEADRVRENAIGDTVRRAEPERERSWFIPTLLGVLLLIVVIAAVVGLTR